MINIYLQIHYNKFYFFYKELTIMISLEYNKYKKNSIQIITLKKQIYMTMKMRIFIILKEMINNFMVHIKYQLILILIYYYKYKALQIYCQIIIIQIHKYKLDKVQEVLNYLKKQYLKNKTFLKMNQNFMFKYFQAVKVKKILWKILQIS